MPGTFRLVRSEFGFLCTLFAASLALVLWCQAQPGGDEVKLPYQLGWTAVTSVAAYLFLDAIRFLDSFRTRPSRTDLLTLYLSLLVPFLLFKQVYFAFTGLAILRYREIFAGLPAVAVLTWAYRYLSGLLFERTGGFCRVWALLDGAETMEFQRELNNIGLTPYYKFVGNADQADLVVMSRVGTGQFQSSPDLLMAHLNGVPVRDLRQLLAEIRGREDLDALNLWFFLITATPQRRMFRMYVRLKSLVEPVLAALLLLLLSPLALVAALGVLLSGPGPILYRQRRSGYLGKQFELVKFRSMVHNAEVGGPAWAAQQEAKVTPFGKFLRRSHLDEIPQLWNVIRGEMSFVGPRPERPEYYAILSQEIPLFWIRTLVRPGITGWAQVLAGYAASVEESKEKLEFDLYYMKHMSPVMDLKIFVKTVLLFVSAKDELAL